MDLIQAAWPYVVGSGGAISVLGLVGRWVMKVERSFDKNVSALDLLLEKLNGHEQVDEVRHQALDHRLAIIEKSVGVAPARSRL